MSLVSFTANNADAERLLHPVPLFVDNFARHTGEHSVEPPELTSQYWFKKGQKTLISHLHRLKNSRKAKNVIFFLGDGMGMSTITAARIYSGQLKGENGENASLPFEKFPNIGLSKVSLINRKSFKLLFHSSKLHPKTYCIDKQTADSACSATAYLGGVKGNYYTIGVNGKVKTRDCAAARDPKNRVSSLAYWAQKAGKATGLITTTPVTHASPAGVYGHTPCRLWESDTDVLKDRKNPEECEDLASQLVNGEVGEKLNIIFGGGRSKFLPNSVVDSEGNPGHRSDSVDLIEIWKSRHPNGVVVNNKEELSNVSSSADSILGLFASSYMSYNLEANRTVQPSVSEMTTAAIELLSKQPKGFFLFVEGGRIDSAHHETKARLALDETNEFAKAVKAALDVVDLRDTLIVVTADHSHTMSISGFGERGNDILGTLENVVEEIWRKDNPITTLNYANGPKSSVNADGTQLDLKNAVFGKKNTKEETEERPLIDRTFSEKDYEYPATFKSVYSAHGGEDVPVYAAGPHAHLFTGVYEQSTIPYIIKYAACIGRGLKACDS